MILLSPLHYIPPTRSIDRVFLHCSASDATGPVYERDALADTVRSWHLQRGWSDVGYHFLIDKAGTVMTGRPLDRTPAAQRGHNTGTLAIMVHGLDADQFTDAGLDACKRLVLGIAEAHNWRVTVHGHREVSNKTCPVFDYRTLLALDAYGRLPLAPQYAGPVTDGGAP